MRGATVVHGKARYPVWVHSIPAAGHTLRVLTEGDAESALLQVKGVLFEVGASGRTVTVELRVQRRGSLVLPAGNIVPRFWTDVDWPATTTPPSFGDSVRLRGEEAVNRAELQVWDVVHDIDQAGKRQAIKVRVVDASPKRVFTDELIRRAEREDIEPLFTD